MLRLRGCSANWMPSLVRIVWIRQARLLAGVQGTPTAFAYQLDDCELTGAVNADEQVKLAFGSLNVGDIYVKKPIG